MAHLMVDLDDVDGPGARAERLLVDALRHSLDDGWFLYPRLAYLDPRRAAEGESDVLVLHREHGLLAIECKGVGVRRSEGRWVRLLDDGVQRPMRESPFEQAQRTVKALARLLTERARALFPGLERLPFVHGHAVAFPLAASTDGLPIEGPREVVLLSEDLRDAGGWARRALALWARGHARPEPLDETGFRRFRKQVLHPSVKIVPSLASALDAERERFARLSAEQLEVVDGFEDNARLSIEGAAGTGKSLVALELARRAAARGERVLLTCFTKALAARLRHDAGDFHVAPGGAIEVAHFHALAFSAARALGRPLAVPGPDDPDARARFWRDDAPLVLAEALAAGALSPFDTLVVDEAQDFEPLWWMVLEEALARRPGARLAMLHDPAQLLYGRAAAVPDAPRFKLTRNFRNTRELAETARRLHAGAAPAATHAPLGEPPAFVFAKGPGRVRDALEALVTRLVVRERLSPRDLVILTPHSRARSSLAGLDAVAGLPLVDHRLPQPGDALSHATISGFKGLEADVVVLLDLDPDDPRCSRAARYVAASRARHRLHVIGEPDWMR